MIKIITFFSLFTIASLSGYSQPPDSSSITPTEKVYGLSKFWSEVNYNFAFYDKLNKAQ
jgi:hypothetical protein